MCPAPICSSLHQPVLLQFKAKQLERDQTALSHLASLITLLQTETSTWYLSWLVTALMPNRRPHCSQACNAALRLTGIRPSHLCHASGLLPCFCSSKGTEGRGILQVYQEALHKRATAPYLTRMMPGGAISKLRFCPYEVRGSWHLLRLGAQSLPGMLRLVHHPPRIVMEWEADCMLGICQPLHLEALGLMEAHCMLRKPLSGVPRHGAGSTMEPSQPLSEDSLLVSSLDTACLKDVLSEVPAKVVM